MFKQYENKSYIAKGFIENFDKFKTFEEYFEDYKKRKYELENSKAGGIHQYLINRLNLRNSLYTIKGEKVKSIEEVRIANFLYINAIDYSYEKIFDEKVNEDVSYQPDFTIEYQGRKIYIEYFRLDSVAEEMPFAEERRLFYVALTRTKNKVYLVVPNNRINKSEFVNEIENII